MDPRHELQAQPSAPEKIDDADSLTESTATEAEEQAVKNQGSEIAAEQAVDPASLIEPAKSESEQEDNGPSLSVDPIIMDSPRDAKEEPVPSEAPNSIKLASLQVNAQPASSGAGLMPTPRYEDFAEKGLPLSDDESSSESFEKDFADEFSKLTKTWNLLNKKTHSSRAWMLQDLMSHFTAANTYDLDKEERCILVDDLQAVNEVLSAEESFLKSKDKEGKFDASLEKDFHSKLNNLLACAAEEPSSKREIFITIGIGLSILALGITIGVLIAGLSPFIVAGCALATIGLLASSAIAHYHLTNHTFFGQTQSNHALMANLALSAANTLEPEKVVGCFGKA